MTQTIYKFVFLSLYILKDVFFCNETLFNEH